MPKTSGDAIAASIASISSLRPVNGHAKRTESAWKDVVHDVVGFPGSPHHGKDGARKFYEELTANFRTEGEHALHRYLADDSMVLEQVMTGTVVGSLLGLPGHGRRISFRILHVFEFRDGLISRENVWLDTAAVVSQLS
jgi:steroid delta-isomerase-like uncharacterized protein